MTTTPQVLPLPESTYQLLLEAACAWPDHVATQWIPDPAVYTGCLTWTYTDLAGTVTRIANGLASLGVRRPDAVTLCGPNTSQLFAATLAAQAAGIAAPVNPALSTERIAGLIRQTGSRILIAAGPELDPQLWERLAVVAREARMNAILAVRPDGATGRPPSLPDGGGVPAAYLEDLIAGQPSDHLVGADLPKAGDLAAFVHTGGTTGAPKVAAQTHASQLACGRGIAESSGLAPGEAMLGGLPLFHVNALIVTGIAPMFAGASVVWPGPAGYRDKALYEHFWKIVEHYRIAAMSAVPTVYATLARLPVDAGISSLRLPIAGASPLPSAVREGFARRTGVRLLEGYGLTEATCASTWTRPGEERTGSVGRALPGQQVKAIRIGDDGSWADCAPGETGVLAIGGPAVFAGYLTDPGSGGPRVSRGDAVRDGWLDTGDLGHLDTDGFVYLTGRAKDLIIRGGHNIDPRVIEEALLRDPAVAAAAAVGSPDPHSGEVPVAYVVPADPGQFDEDELLAWASTAIGEPAARPKRIHPIQAIPPDLEELLLARVGQHPLITFHRGAEVSGLDGATGPLAPDPVRVHARVAADMRTFTGCLVLGCDGAGSTIRDLAGITMQDLGFTERWLVIDIRAPAGLDTWDGVEQVCDPARAATFMQVTGDRYRWEFQLRDGEDETALITPPGARPAAAAMDRAQRPHGPGGHPQHQLHLPRPAGHALSGRAGLPARRRRPPHPAVHRPGPWQPGCATPATSPGRSHTCSPASPARTCSPATTPSAARTPAP